LLRPRSNSNDRVSIKLKNTLKREALDLLPGLVT
jgi:hypothetical protein